MKTYPYKQVNCLEDLPTPAAGTNLIVHYVFQYIDFNEVPEYATSHQFIDCCFFGCKYAKGQFKMMDACLELPRMGMVFRAFHKVPYTGETLYEGFNPDDMSTFETCYDSIVYSDYIKNGKRSDDLRVTLARALHDHSMSDVMHSFLQRYDPQDVVGIMGGHSLPRDSEGFRQIVFLSKALAEKGKLMVSGGGPGAMEATHVGAWMASRSNDEVEDALSILAQAPGSEDVREWVRTAFVVRNKYPQHRFHSLAIPTWLYGYEPSTPFATEIAKYFDNSIREDTILTVAVGGIIFTPGSAGTIQEIFQDATQNHYLVHGTASPMVFLGKEYYTKDLPVYSFLDDLQRRGKYSNLPISITDDSEEIIRLLC